MCDEYTLVQDSGGAGEHRGGMGIARQVRALHDGTSMNCRSDSHKFGALGIDGGGRGREGPFVPQLPAQRCGGTAVQGGGYRASGGRDDPAGNAWRRGVRAGTCQAGAGARGGFAGMAW